MIYKTNKKNKYKKYSLINTSISFDMKKRKDKDSKGTIKFYREDLINKVVKKNINNRFKKLLEIIVGIEEEGNSPDGLLLCLNEVAKFKRELINKYESYLDKRQKELVEKKIEIIEKDLKVKLMALTVMKRPLKKEKKDYEEEKIERHHSR